MIYWIVVEYLCLMFIGAFELGNWLLDWEVNTVILWCVLVFAVLKQIQNRTDF